MTNLSQVVHGTGCSAKDTLYAGVEFYYQENIDVMIGSPCSSGNIPLGLLTSQWNLPHISWVSTSPVLADKTVYTTLGRTLGSFSKMGPAFVDIFRYFGWNRTVILSSEDAVCSYSSEAANGALIKNGIRVVDYDTFTLDITDSEMIRLWKKTKLVGRIIIFCASAALERHFLLLAHDIGMSNGEYVFLNVKLLDADQYIQPWFAGDDRDGDARHIYGSVFQISYAKRDKEETYAFMKEVLNKSAGNPENITVDAGVEISASPYSPFLHDAMILYAMAANKTLEMGGDIRDGELMFDNMKGIVFSGKSGTVVMDNNVEREPNYWVKDLRSDGFFGTIMEVSVNVTGQRSINVFDVPIWGNELTDPPPDTPVCGFLNELCSPDEIETNLKILIIVVIVMFLVCLVVVVSLYYRRRKLEEELANTLWKVRYDEIVFDKTRRFGSMASDLSLQSLKSDKRSRSSQLNVPSIVTDQIFTKTGLYRDALVAIKRLNRENIVVDREDLLEIKALRDMHHLNVNAFIGICPDEPNVCILTQYCPKGSFQDVLQNDDIKLDWLFKTSLLTDLVSGMEYIHKSRVGSHGRLKSSNCVIDSRWVLKVTDYGLNRFKSHTQDDGDYAYHAGLLWTAPEILRSSQRPLNGTQKGDIYSFAIIIGETLTRSGPFDTHIHSPREIVELVSKGGTPPFRPGTIAAGKNTKEQFSMISLMQKCWDEDESMRPTFREIKTTLSIITRGKNTNIVDNILNMMEKYANNLEDIVEERTRMLMEEKKKTDKLLYSMLPRSVADQLKLGRRVDAELYDQVTIFFSDIVGFTQLGAESTPLQVVDFLNDLYTMFDDTIVHFDVYKIETIGDAYMVVSGLPQRNGRRHAGEIANMALNLLCEVTKFKIRHLPGRQLQLRIGIHSGPCVAGVVGLTMPRFCLFGDTVNTASRMESFGQALRIHISPSTARALEALGGYKMTPRGSVNIKRKQSLYDSSDDSVNQT
uniref:Guanylate cyclase n=1 Tax=Saccoglossus kowalevskii TaxID=10224 RepID=A0ABM0LTQ3_SACKO|nr:PREDICTED: atrial natriuretic peptide receptor 1-like [Saccoglossus kowalevskii]